ncbi:hypothetical protein RO3G_10447 [Rhizopus delemar RA 99-880]|uniref:Uncharacterized protein n=1 Tax=Rhizopus delemar (strain RA 99-880 / ATCC MYA-4621 / FGSC 9543 / NRRL 43880) TaxID=246409 RepID=I1CBA7_RHIO9|nr:hypothetical protein RO3G_10447 [Rhizopus delemar RA 99-880]|eukprot:EIE85737.1 hypothetical protein RO3G_10447 [Rhizopus delemar RA 99-880]
MVNKLVPNVRQRSKLLVNWIGSSTIGSCIYMMSQKNSNMLGVTPKKSNVTFQLQAQE